MYSFAESNTLKDVMFMSKYGKQERKETMHSQEEM